MNLQNYIPPATPGQHDAFNEGMLHAYYEGRDAVRPYTPPAAQPEQYPTPAPAQVGEVVKVAATLGGVAAVGYIAAVTVTAVAGAVVAFVEANAVIIGGAGAAIVVGLLSLFAWSNRDRGEQAGAGGPPPGGNWEFYQRQEQGWRKRQ